YTCDVSLSSTRRSSTFSMRFTTSDVIRSVSGTSSPSQRRDRLSSVLFFSFSFSYFLFHCSAVSSRLMEAVFLIVLALRQRKG
uniref:Uncharacterized protein n=1 Tax=Gouania willdenowi TaxID=441366 RepID=A0A8C5N2E1_GOUWI